MSISEKTAYLRGLMDGLQIDKNGENGKMFAAIVDVLDEVASRVAMIEEHANMVDEELDLMEDAIDMLDEDLTEVLEVLEVDECGCGHHHGDEDEDWGTEEFYSYTCPTCGEELEIGEDVVERGKTKCPVCGEDIEFDLSGLYEDEDEEGN